MTVCEGTVVSAYGVGGGCTYSYSTGSVDEYKDAEMM